MVKLFLSRQLRLTGLGRKFNFFNNKTSENHPRSSKSKSVVILRTCALIN